MRQNFSAVIEFDAHRADFANRLALLEALATVDLAGKTKLRAAVAVLQRDRDDKLDTTARIIVDLLSDLLTCRHVEALRDPLRVAAQRREIEERFREKLIARETEAHREIIRAFAHQRVAVRHEGPREWLSDGLFVERTWSLLGLNGWRLLAAGAGGGALVGAKIDLLFGGATWGLGAALGGAVGGGAALAGSRTAPGLKVNLPYFSRAIVGTELVAGPHPTRELSVDRPRPCARDLRLRLPPRPRPPGPRDPRRRRPRRPLASHPSRLRPGPRRFAQGPGQSLPRHAQAALQRRPPRGHRGHPAGVAPPDLAVISARAGGTAPASPRR
ncbi:MAG: DUF3482 domain-containing protein [Chthoniobacter sp.]